MLESKVEKSICDFAKKRKFIVIKLNAKNYKGLPDRMFLKNGKSFFIEFKKQGETLRTIQRVVVEKFKRNGFKVHVVDNITYGEHLVKLYDKIYTN